MLSFRQFPWRICRAGNLLQYFSSLLCQISSEQFVGIFCGLLPWSAAIQTGVGAKSTYDEMVAMVCQQCKD